MHRKMQVRCLALLLTGAAGAFVGCGGEDFANEPRPPAPENLDGVVQATGVTVSPNRRGAGPFVITISNQTDEARTLTVEGDSVEETVGPVQPMDTATIQVTLEQGRYEVRAGSARAVAKEIPPAQLTIGPPRASSADQLLLP